MTGQWRIGALMALTACGGGNASGSDPEACAPLEAAADSTLRADGMAGDYTVRLVATTGAKRGATSAGTVRLMAHDSARQHIVLPDGTTSTTYAFPLYGTGEIDLAPVGATAPGEIGSDDPAAPGVLVIESSGGVLLRLGSEANRTGVRRFDGAYTALQVRQITDKGFAGTWRSGVGHGGIRRPLLRESNELTAAVGKTTAGETGWSRPPLSL